MACLRLASGMAMAVLLVGTSRAQAQVIGTFTWQTQPYCNIVTLTVIQQGALFQLTGTDNLCGAGAAPVTGTAVPAGGGVAFGFTIALPTGGAAHLSATIALATLSGTWTDADGHTGPLTFGASSGGPSRPAPAPATAITVSQFSPTVYGGTGAASTVARSDHDHDVQYYTKSQADARVAAVAAVAFEGPGIFVAPTLVVQSDHSPVAETVNTPKTGQLMIAKSFIGSAQCTSGTAHYHFLTVDGVPLRSSARYVAASVTFDGSLIGVTAGVISAGAHTISVGSQCLSGTTNGASRTHVSTTSVVVLP